MEKTITEQLDEITCEICDQYCKYPDIAKGEVKDAAAAEDYLYRKYCESCPLNRI